jgi:hypothetical protein
MPRKLISAIGLTQGGHFDVEYTPENQPFWNAVHWDAVAQYFPPKR